MPIELLVTMIVAVLAIIAVAAVVVWRAKVRVPPGGALVIYGVGPEPRITFSDAVVMPIVARAVALDLSARTVTIEREGRDGVRCADDIKVDIRAEFRVAVNPTAEDVLKVMRAIGSRASDPVVLHELFEAKFASGIASVMRMMSFDQATRMREELRDHIIEVIGADLDGFVLQDLALVRIEQVPLELLDPNNVLDAKAITLIQQRVMEEQRRTNELKLDMAREAAHQQIRERELALEVERFGR